MSLGFMGYMLRPNENHFPTEADNKFCRDLAYQIFGTRDPSFCETHAGWWLLLCVIFRFEITDMLEVWENQP